MLLQPHCWRHCVLEHFATQHWYTILQTFIWLARLLNARGGRNGDTLCCEIKGKIIVSTDILFQKHTINTAVTVSKTIKMRQRHRPSIQMYVHWISKRKTIANKDDQSHEPLVRHRVNTYRRFVLWETHAVGDQITHSQRVSLFATWRNKNRAELRVCKCSLIILLTESPPLAFAWWVQTSSYRQRHIALNIAAAHFWRGETLERECAQEVRNPPLSTELGKSSFFTKSETRAIR